MVQNIFPVQRFDVGGTVGVQYTTPELSDGSRDQLFGEILDHQNPGNPDSEKHCFCEGSTNSEFGVNCCAIFFLTLNPVELSLNK